MNISNSQIRARARDLLDDNIFGKDWLKSVLVYVIAVVIVLLAGGSLFLLSNEVLYPLVHKYIGNISPVLNVIIWIIFQLFDIFLLNILIGPLNVGITSVYIDLVRETGDVKVGKFFHGFKNFFSNFILGIMYSLLSFLWTLFFFVPGVYMTYSYALVFHVKRDNPDYDWKECLDESERLMEGNRWKFFKLQISFIGWSLLGTLALFGIGSLWVYPYINTSNAIFYEQVRIEKDIDMML